MPWPRVIPILSSAIVGLAVVACSGAGSATGTASGPIGAASGPIATASPVASAADSGSGVSRGGRYDYGVASPAASSGSLASAGPNVVLLTGFKFEPTTLTVPLGTTLSFTNNDPAAHAIVEGENGTPAAGQTPLPVPPTATVTIPFAVAGSINVTCTIHPTMNLTVTVTP